MIIYVLIFLVDTIISILCLFIFFIVYVFFLLFVLFLFFFFKQKTAYELRISDWSSDVCSSDLSASTIPAPCKSGASIEISGTSRADSLNPITDSLNPIQGDARPVSADADAMLAAYHERLPQCQSVAVLNDKRPKRIAAAPKLATQVCRQQGWPYEAPEFWDAYVTDDPAAHRTHALVPHSTQPTSTNNPNSVPHGDA